MKQPTVSLRLLLPAFAFSASAGIAQTPDPVDPELGANRAQVRAADELPRLPEVLNILSTESVDRHGKGLALAHLVAQGPRAVPAIFALLTGTAPIPPELAAKGPVLTRERREMLMQAMRSWDSERVAEELSALLDATPSTGAAIMAMRILGEVGDSRSLESLLEIVDATDPTVLLHPAVRRPTVDGLTRTLERDSLGYVVLKSMLRDLSEVQLDLVVEALANAGEVEGIEILEALLGRRPERDYEILEAFAGVGVRGRALTGEMLRSAAMAYLESPDSASRGAAAALIGNLRDPSLFGELVGLLNDENPSVAASALEALQSMSGTSWPAQARRWTRWYAREQAWLDAELPQLERQIASADPETVLGALRSLREHPLFATRLAAVVGQAVRHEDRGVAAIACEALGQLGQPASLEPLLEALYDPRERVREAAGESLRRLTGLDLPDDGAAWRRWFEGSND